MGTGAGCGLVGSSPLTRGKRRRGLRGRRVGRLIPAHAGKTRDGLRYSSGHPAHPRSRGENTPRPFTASHRAGSSPLTRGKRGDAASVAMLQRLIPAHAGKTVVYCLPASAVAAHPRSRGENARAGRPPRSAGGSSPLTRGKRRLLPARVGGRRLIPAHAGKTRRCTPRKARGPAHPRSRGENDVVILQARHVDGSSPLTRGKHFLTCAFTAQIDQILETLELAASSGSYSIWVACATDAPQDQVQSIGLVLPSSRGAS